MTSLKINSLVSRCGYFTGRNGTELRSKIQNGTGLTERSFWSEKGSRPLDYVHNVILECKTVHYSYCIKNIIKNLQSMLKKDRNAHMQASNAGNYIVKKFGLLQPYFGHLSCMPLCA